MTVREATPADVETIRAFTDQDAWPVAHLIRESWPHTPFRGPRHVLDRQVEIVLTFMANPMNAGFVMAVDDALVGYIAASVFQHNLSLERWAMVVGWWVTPAARGRGLQLLDTVENWARDQGADELHCGAHTSEMERLCRGIGFRRYEVDYVKVL